MGLSLEGAAMSYGGGGGPSDVDTSRTLELRLTGRPAPEEVRRLCALLDAAEPTDVVCELGGLGRRADLGAVDAVARLRLAARRRGHRLTFRGAGPELRAVLDLAGLGDLL
ncbi:STAS domain-containing protein [Streptomyces sp. NPDC094032]|uniref:STAS domain-containing protein n=1 Tax=Streptomyces sp. NPDC094032 TaxID=3155308 RepID=UPI003321DDCF